MSEPVILEAIRTPFARRDGAFREIRPDRLLAHALIGVLSKARLDGQQIDDVIVGAVTQSGEQGANVGRLGVLAAGFPVQVPAVTLNRMCGSSQQALHFAAQAVAAGDMHYVVASGVESMTRVPMFSDLGGSFSGEIRLAEEYLAPFGQVVRDKVMFRNALLFYRRHVEGNDD